MTSDSESAHSHYYQTLGFLYVTGIFHFLLTSLVNLVAEIGTIFKEHQPQVELNVPDNVLDYYS